MNFESLRFFWGLFNALVLVFVVALPIWILIKIHSIDKTLKKLLSKMDDDK
jgi:hypothetical protein